MKEQQKTDEEPLLAVDQRQFTVTEPYDGNKLSKGAFSKINRELTEDDLKSPGTQRLILNELDKYEACKAELDFYRKHYYEVTSECKVYEEKLKSNTTNEVASGFLLALGPSLMTLAPSIVNKNGDWYYLSTIVLFIGILLLSGGIIAKIIKRFI